MITPQKVLFHILFNYSQMDLHSNCFLPISRLTHQHAHSSFSTSFFLTPFTLTTHFIVVQSQSSTPLPLLTPPHPPRSATTSGWSHTRPRAAHSSGTRGRTPSLWMGKHVSVETLRSWPQIVSLKSHRFRLCFITRRTRARRTTQRTKMRKCNN